MSNRVAIALCAVLWLAGTAGAAWHKTRCVVKNAAESVTNSDVMQDDNDMAGSFTPGTTIMFTMDLHFVSASAVPDAKFRYHEAVVGSTIVANCAYDEAGVSAGIFPLGLFDEDHIITITAGQVSNVNCRGIIFVNGGGNYSVQWAQNSANATATILNAGSYYRFQAVTQ